MTQIHYPKPCTWPFLTLALVDPPTVLHPTMWSLTKKKQGAYYFLMLGVLLVQHLEMQTLTSTTPQLLSTTSFASCSCFALSVHLSRALPFFHINHWLRKCDPVCLLPHPLWKESVFARGPDVEHCCSLTRIHVSHSKARTPLSA